MTCDPRTNESTSGGPSAATLCSLIDVRHADRVVTVGDAELHVAAPPAVTTTDLSVWLYLHLHVGNPEALGLDALRPDQSFEDAIHDALPARRVPLARTAARAMFGDGAAGRDVDRVWVVEPADPTGTDIQLPCARPNLSPGFFMFVHEADVDPTAALNRFYVAHDDPWSALEDWTSSVETLLDHGAPFRTKMLSRRRAYPRHDALVFYGRGDVDNFAGCLRQSRGRRDFAEVSFSRLCRRLPGGVAVGAEPAGPALLGQKSFGEHRCDALADAIIASLDRSSDLVEKFIECCSASNIDPTDVSRNVR